MDNPKLELTREIHSGRHEWVLLEDWEVCGYVVPAGFKTDLGSIPRIFWSIVGPQEIAHGAILHDYLYDQRVTTRKEADRLLRTLVRPEVGSVRAYMVWAIVRLFGGRYYGLGSRL